MAVQQLYYTAKDGLEGALQNPATRLLAHKKEADARDRMLELAEEIQVFLEKRVDGLSDELAEQVSVVIAENSALFQKALKKPSVLNESAGSSGDPAG